MQKPITVVRQDFAKSVVELARNAGLPAFVTADVLEGILAEARGAELAEYRRDKAKYDEAIKKETEKESQQKGKDQ